jgi:ribonuclease HII
MQINGLILNMLDTFMRDDVVEAGCDEVGRGCMAGPVVCAAVIWPKDINHNWLKDSKMLNIKQREEMDAFVREEAVAFAVAEMSPAEIDQHNVLQASFLGMHKALDLLDVQPGHLLIDGNRFIPYKAIPYHTVVKGDSKYAPIAAASIIAKVYRDKLMKELHEEHPEYGWETNVGYPTPKHRQAIINKGYTKYHRKSFKLKAVQTKLF